MSIRVMMVAVVRKEEVAFGLWQYQGTVGPFATKEDKENVSYMARVRAANVHVSYIIILVQSSVQW